MRQHHVRNLPLSVTDRRIVEDVTAATQPLASGDGRRESWWRRLPREPLLHFLLLGAALFIAYAYLRKGKEASSRGPQIVVSAGKIEQLAAIFTRTWQRPPSQQEVEELINDYIREEAAYREGVAMGLDQNDTIIRRRVRQKLDFVAEDLASQLQPTDEDLATYLQTHADDFRVAPRLSFRQVFFDPEKHGDGLGKIVNDSIATLQDAPSVDAQEMGDRTLLEFRYENVSQRDVGSLFGEHFASEIFKIEPGKWQGPKASAYGAHAVIVDDFDPGRQRQLEEVRDAVQREWDHARRAELTEKFYQELLEKYDVIIAWPEAEAVED